MAYETALDLTITSTQQEDTKWLPRVRLVWLALIVPVFVIFLYSIPGTYKMLTTICDLSPEQCASWAQPTSTLVDTLDQHHISLEAYAIYHLILYVTVALLCWGAGLLVLRYRSRDWHGLVVSYMLITLGAGGVSMVLQSGQSFTALPNVLEIVSGGLIMPMYLALSLFFQTFPDGRIYPRWTQIGTLLILANYAAWLAPGQFNIQNWKPFLAGLWLLSVFGFHIGIQAYRYRYFYTQEQRQQTKWLIWGFGISLISAIFLPLVLDSSSADLIEGTTVALGFYLPITVAITIAILRYRLWDIDIIINRTLLYGLLTTLTIGLYILIVGSLSFLFQAQNSLFISLMATGVVAVAFQPMRSRLQTTVDHFIFGERKNPYSVIARLNEELGRTRDDEALLPDVAETIAQALKLPYVAIAVKDDESFQTEAIHGQVIVGSRLTSLPLTYSEQIVGQIIIGQAPGDRVMDEHDQQLLQNIARQTGIAVHAVQLNRALQQSRQQLVTAREEERRRLRRDLHDGLGPALAAHTIKIGTARILLSSDPQAADRILDDLENSLAESLADIRRLVYNLRPPALDQLGLYGALQDFVQQYTGPTTFVLTLPDTFPRLSAAVEVAVYRLIQEAVNNVVRHARATHCVIKIEAGDVLTVHISDNGIGLPQPLQYGVGLNSMRERADELGGHFAITSSESGTQVAVWLPLE